MTYELKPCPKPSGKLVGGGKPRPKPRMKRSRLKCGAGSKRRGKSSFPKQRDAKYRRWIRTENDCLLRGSGSFPCVTLVRLSMRDNVISRDGDMRVWWVHNCWGPIDPAHVGDSQARGAPDFGVIVPLCRAAHDYYDHHRSKWRKATGYSEKQMASAASGYALKYVEQGGTPLKETT